MSYCQYLNPDNNFMANLKKKSLLYALVFPNPMFILILFIIYINFIGEKLKIWYEDDRCVMEVKFLKMQ